MIIDAKNYDYTEINRLIRESSDEKIELNNVLGQRYLGAGTSGKELLINGTPGNALGAYLNGSKIIVHGNAQDAIGDTMNGGAIIVHGNCGDTTGYAMRSGEIYVQGNAGYRVWTSEKLRGTLSDYRHRRQGRGFPRRISGGRYYNRVRNRRRGYSRRTVLRYGYARRRDVHKK